MTNSKNRPTILVLSAAIAAGLVVTAASTASYAERFVRNHPRRAEVLGRDRRLNNRINRNYGNLNGNYGKLEHQDRMIHKQERHEARVNGGYLTKGEKKQLNKEENHLNREIKRDKTK